jgi:hypothetical protein|tara:strand:+ start:74 stop:298 length:225 start_codon:yes stop_codon:yes gene_type:complete
MRMTTYQIKLECDQCDGQGDYVIKNEYDPAAKVFDCEVCDATGVIEVIEDYPSVAAMERDYPEYISIASKGVAL